MGAVSLLNPRNLIHLVRSYEFGPCVGIPRLERWERAQALGLNPPKEVLICIIFLIDILKFHVMAGL